MPSDLDRMGLARFLHRIGGLKRTPRTGWLDRGVAPEATESVADHSFRVAVMAWLAAQEMPDLERDRVLKLALIHDLAEALTGDLPPYDREELAKLDTDERRKILNQRQYGDSALREQKHALERVAIAELAADLPPALADEILDLWAELRDLQTPEARFVKEIDRLETWLQSREYLQDDPTLPMDSFALEVEETIASPSLRALQEAARDSFKSHQRG